jgi:hypothetical protein
MDEKYLQYSMRSSGEFNPTVKCDAAFVLIGNKLFRLKRDGGRMEIDDPEQIRNIIAGSFQISQGTALNLLQQQSKRTVLSWYDRQEEERERWLKIRENELGKAEVPLLEYLGEHGAWRRIKSILTSLCPLTHDKIYRKVKTYQLKLYQWYSNEEYFSVSLQSFHPRMEMDRLYSGNFRFPEKVKFISSEAKKKHWLDPDILQVMIAQYIFADLHERCLYRDRWVYRVIKRERIDYFPDSETTYLAVIAGQPKC